MPYLNQSQKPTYMRSCFETCQPNSGLFCHSFLTIHLLVLAPSFHFQKTSHIFMSIPTLGALAWVAISGLLAAALYWLVNLLHSHPFDNVRGPSSSSWLTGLRFDFQPCKSFGWWVNIGNRVQLFDPTDGIRFMHDITQKYGGVVRLQGVFGVRYIRIVNCASESNSRIRHAKCLFPIHWRYTLSLSRTQQIGNSLLKFSRQCMLSSFHLHLFRIYSFYV